MSTHYIEEAERLADTVAIMSATARRSRSAGRPTSWRARRPEALEVYGPPARLREVEADARGRGWPTRRTGTSVTILRAETPTATPDGERRPANLEDVFVLLTGEEIA